MTRCHFSRVIRVEAPGTTQGNLVRHAASATSTRHGSVRAGGNRQIQPMLPHGRSWHNQIVRIWSRWPGTEIYSTYTATPVASSPPRSGTRPCLGPPATEEYTQDSAGAGATSSPAAERCWRVDCESQVVVGHISALWQGTIDTTGIKIATTGRERGNSNPFSASIEASRGAGIEHVALVKTSAREDCVAVLSLRPG